MKQYKKLFKRGRRWLAEHQLSVVLVVGFIVLTSSLLLRQLTTLPTTGLSLAEAKVAATPVGWHGLFTDPFYLLVQVFRSIGFYFFDQGGALVSRLPSVLFGAAAIFSVCALLRVWHSTRIAVFGGLLFLTSAWTLHISRYASFDSSYLATIPFLLVTQYVLHRYTRRWVSFLVIFSWSLLVLTPGTVWLAAAALFWQRKDLRAVWNRLTAWWWRSLFVLTGLLWLPALLIRQLHDPSSLLLWIGFSSNFGTIADFGHRLLAVPFHLFVRGPGIPELWLGQLPILDVFTLTMTVLGVVFYARHWRSARARLLALYLGLSILLIGLGGRVTLSLAVPLTYLLAAAGIGFILHDWLKHFPNNPIARGFGITVIAIAVCISAAYNSQHYFVAWPNSPTTISRFTYR